MAGIQIGDRIGDYEVVGVLGRGGMGKVFRVRSVLSDREEAMKVIYPDLQNETELADRFLREIRLHASLDHPNIAALRAALQHEGQIVMILELVPGLSLEERLKNGALPVESATHYISQVLSALAFAHARGVVHRDIKPANILIAPVEIVKLTDFGIARAASDNKLTRTGFAVGSLNYMSPEQIRDQPVDGRSDIYSVGVTLYEAVTGKRPFQEDSQYALMQAHLNQIPVPPCDVINRVPPAISDLIMRALAKDPAARFQSAQEFQNAIQARLPGITETMPAPTSSAISAEELARVESKLVRVLGPIAAHLVKQASRRVSTISDLCHSLAAQIPETADRQSFLKAALGGTGTGSALSQQATAPAAFAPETLGRLEAALAEYVGPIARIVVKRAAKTAHSLEELYSALAAEIPSERDRRRFLSAVER